MNLSEPRLKPKIFGRNLSRKKEKRHLSMPLNYCKNWHTRQDPNLRPSGSSSPVTGQTAKKERMTKKELIEILEPYPDDLPIVLPVEGHGDGGIAQRDRIAPGDQHQISELIVSTDYLSEFGRI